MMKIYVDRNSVIETETRFQILLCVLKVSVYLGTSRSAEDICEYN